MKNLTFCRNILVIVAAIFLASCSNSDRSDEVRLQGKNEQDKPLTTDPVEQTRFNSRHRHPLHRGRHRVVQRQHPRNPLQEAGRAALHETDEEL